MMEEQKWDATGRITTADRRTFIRACRSLDRLMIRIRKYEPEAEYYAAPGCLNLTVGGIYLDDGQAHPESVAESMTITNFDAGAW